MAVHSRHRPAALRPERPTPCVPACMPALASRAAPRPLHTNRGTTCRPGCRYIHDDPGLVPLLEMMRRSGKKLFVATNSLVGAQLGVRDGRAPGGWVRRVGG